MSKKRLAKKSLSFWNQFNFKSTDYKERVHKLKKLMNRGGHFKRSPKA